MSCLLSCTVRKVRISLFGFLLAHISTLPPKDLGCPEFSSMDVSFSHIRDMFTVHISHTEIFIHMIYMRISCFMEFIILISILQNVLHRNESYRCPWKKKEAWGFPGQITLGTYMLYSPLGDSQCLAYHVNNSEKFSRKKKTVGKNLFNWISPHISKINFVNRYFPSWTFIKSPQRWGSRDPGLDLASEASDAKAFYSCPGLRKNNFKVY